MSTTPILTIAIPTYNRADDLARLLATLERSLLALRDELDIFICNNASTDHTREVVDNVIRRWPTVRVLHQSVNLGMDGNFCACAENVRGKYFWLIGDDDLPVDGLVEAIVALLQRDAPDLVYMDSLWLPDLNSAAKRNISGALPAILLSRGDFARRVHVWSTFLSAMVVKKSDLLNDGERLRALQGTHLSQMSWVMERLSNGTRFVHVRAPCILATAGNTGGYAAVKVFGEHFPKIVRDGLPSHQRPLADAIVFRAVLMYLPNLLWSLRNARAGNFQSEDVLAALRPQLGRHPLTTLLLVPVSRAPEPLARAILAASHAAARVVSCCDRLRMIYARWVMT